MKKIELNVSFTTPAFLGNANQEGQWRTPPFKALIRQWWRIVKAKDFDYDYAKLHEAENLLFGKASDSQATRSKLRIRLNKWDCGTGRDNIVGAKVVHREVRRNPNIDSALYLGYGAITTRETKQFIKPLEEFAKLKLMFPDSYEDELINTVQLIAWFGTIGSRSRNGWGSLKVEPAAEMPFNRELNQNLIEKYSQNISAALNLDWPHCIGKDDKGLLIWKTKEKENWIDVIKELAEIKIGYRTELEFPGGKFHDEAQNRHILSYPVTNHDLRDMRNARNPNQLRFKIKQASDNKFYGLIFHLPCKVSDSFFENRKIENRKITDSYRRKEKTVWQSVHKTLDSMPESKIRRLQL